ncbi:Metallo-hydrolase/oxidoreductase [Plenodomus tracheiphilus IPT5]|uniref:Metallo-hydrolase/oxidoreductase n=1 Tax=Plenodomus tracheiphilus IPT5 TaxID=1408161 RepID=A0A6A7B8X0_9PLEO|nr:Metallo-hydrolase/oxidoreductase [Plenodomus tracheiphilus IPT5]
MPDPSTHITPLPRLQPPCYTPTHHTNTPPTHFHNPWPSYKTHALLPTLLNRFTNPTKNYVPIPENRTGTALPSTLTPDFTLAGTHPDSLKATWLGHATFLVETPTPTPQASNKPTADRNRGLNILLDPIFSPRAGPYNLLGPTRFTPLPCTIAALPHIDLILISHDHYDHLDAETLRQIMVKQDGDVRFCCGLGVKRVLVGLGVGITGEQVEEMDWWDGVSVGGGGGGDCGVEIVCTPAQHRSGRTVWGFDATLWCSWVVRSTPSSSLQDNGKSLFFAGDTGYCAVDSDTQFSHHHAPHPPCPAFRQIGDLYGPFDLALLPIGCFKPRSVLSGQHSSPEDSLAIHKDVRSKKSIGMHYGTFRGAYSASFEPVTEPAERWKKGAEAEGLEWGVDVGLCDVGETVMV